MYFCNMKKISIFKSSLLYSKYGTPKTIYSVIPFTFNDHIYHIPINCDIVNNNFQINQYCENELLIVYHYLTTNQNATLTNYENTHAISHNFAQTFSFLKLILPQEYI